MSSARQWVVAAVAGVAVTIGALIGAATLFSAYLSEATRIAPFETPDGILVTPPSPFAPTLSYALAAVLLAVLASVVLSLVAIGVAGVPPRATAPALAAVSVGPFAVLAVHFGGSVYGYWQDPPEAHVGTILGVLPQRRSRGLRSMCSPWPSLGSCCGFGGAHGHGLT